eukprot:6278839-Amphidinium_carterae.1
MGFILNSEELGRSLWCSDFFVAITRCQKRSTITARAIEMKLKLFPQKKKGSYVLAQDRELIQCANYHCDTKTDTNMRHQK